MTTLDTTEVPIGTLLDTDEPATWTLTSTNRTHNGLIIAPRGAATTTLMGHLAEAANDVVIHYVDSELDPDGAATLLAALEHEITTRRTHGNTHLVLGFLEHAEHSFATCGDRWARITTDGPDLGIGLIAHVHRVNTPRTPRGLLDQLMCSNLTVLRGRNSDLAQGRFLPAAPDWEQVPHRPGFGIHYQNGAPRPVRFANGISSWPTREMSVDPDFPHGHGLADADLAAPQYCDCGHPLDAHHDTCQEPR